MGPDGPPPRVKHWRSVGIGNTHGILLSAGIGSGPVAVEAASENRGVTSLVGQTGDLKTGPTAITSSSSKLNRVLPVGWSDTIAGSKPIGVLDRPRTDRP